MITILYAFPTALIFFAAFAAARPTAHRVAFASWAMCVMAVLTGLVFPVINLFAWGMGAAMSAGTQTGLPLFASLQIFSGIPYYLWFAATIVPIPMFSAARRWDIIMHFIYAPAYLLLYIYSWGSGAGFTLLTHGAVVASLIPFWYRLTDLQARTETT